MPANTSASDLKQVSSTLDSGSGPTKQSLVPVPPGIDPQSQAPSAAVSAMLVPYEMAPDDFVTYGPREVHGYVRIPPARFSGFAANDWGVDESDVKLVLRLIAHGYHAASIILEADHEEHGRVHFGKCPLNVEQIFQTVGTFCCCWLIVHWTG